MSEYLKNYGRFSQNILHRLRECGSDILKKESVDEKGKPGELQLSLDEAVDYNRPYLAFEQTYPIVEEGVVQGLLTSIRIWVFDRQKPKYLEILNEKKVKARRMKRKDVLTARLLMQNMEGQFP